MLYDSIFEETIFKSEKILILKKTTYIFEFLFKFSKLKI